MGTLVISDGHGEFRFDVGGEAWRTAIIIDQHVGGSDGRGDTAAFEPGPGYVIADFRVARGPVWGDASYTISQLADDSMVERIEKLTSNIEGHLNSADENRDEKTKSSLEFMLKQFRDYYSRYSVKNRRIEVSWHVQSREIKVLGVVVDTKTANLSVSVDALVVRLINPSDWANADVFINNALSQGRSLTINYA